MEGRKGRWGVLRRWEPREVFERLIRGSNNVDDTLIFVCLQRGFCDSEMENYKHNELWIEGSFSMSENNVLISDALRP